MKAIDLFAGWGGFTEGAELAGVDVVWAANHWELAVRAHAANHPRTLHVCQDLRQADFSRLPAYDLLLASPACQGHSPASQPRRREYHDAMRATAWAVTECAEVTRPRAIIVENVPAFERWALFDLWAETFRRLGYQTQYRYLQATDFGVPQRRKRLVYVATRKSIRLEFPTSITEPAFGPCIDWDVPMRKRVAAAPENVRARIAKARARGLGARFLSQHVTDHPGVPLNEPIRTITTKDQWIVVDGDRYRSLTIRELARGMSFRDTYAWPSDASRIECIQGLGNAVPPLLARGVVAHVADAVS